MNTTMITQPQEDTFLTTIATAAMISYCIGLIGFVLAYGNRPGARAWTTIGTIVAPIRIGPTGWRPIGTVTFSPADVSPPILQKSPLYERTYASGKKSWRFWDDLTEEWVYRSALPTDMLSS